MNEEEYWIPVKDINIFKGEYLKIKYTPPMSSEQILYVQCLDVQQGNLLNHYTQSIIFIGKILIQRKSPAFFECVTLHKVNKIYYSILDAYPLKIDCCTKWDEIDIQFISQKEFDEVKQLVTDLLS